MAPIVSTYLSTRRTVPGNVAKALRRNKAKDASWEVASSSTGYSLKTS